VCTCSSESGPGAGRAGQVCCYTFSLWSACGRAWSPLHADAAGRTHTGLGGLCWAGVLPRLLPVLLLLGQAHFVKMLVACVCVRMCTCAAASQDSKPIFVLACTCGSLSARTPVPCTLMQSSVRTPVLPHVWCADSLGMSCVSLLILLLVCMLAYFIR